MDQASSSSTSEADSGSSISDEITDTKEISIREKKYFIDYTKIIGSGKDGKVYIATCDNVEYAAKVIKSDTCFKNEKNVCFEYSCLHEIKHESIVKVFGWTEEKNYIIMELIKGQLENNYTEDALRKIFKQIFNVVIFIHHNSLLHGDLHNHNIMIGAEANPVLIDFGRAKWIHRDHGILKNLPKDYDKVTLVKDIKDLKAIFSILLNYLDFQSKATKAFKTWLDVENYVGTLEEIQENL
uniref:Protein kinase domain-containing protein n=1 Tax=Panagrolaimus sp. ES5 TaxID=591445 RepID=A0AC34FBU3_9BILA